MLPVIVNHDQSVNYKIRLLTSVFLHIIQTIMCRIV